MTINIIGSAVELSEGNLHLKVTNDELQKSMSLFAKSTVKRRWTVDSHWRKYIYSDKSQIVVGSNNCIDVWRNDEVNRPD
jgi:hypothetical protein